MSNKHKKFNTGDSSMDFLVFGIWLRMAAFMPQRRMVEFQLTIDEKQLNERILWKAKDIH